MRDLHVVHAGFSWVLSSVRVLAWMTYASTYDLSTAILAGGALWVRERSNKSLHLPFRLVFPKSVILLVVLSVLLQVIVPSVNTSRGSFLRIASELLSILAI